MNKEFKKCPNGHYYQGDTCPYCKPQNGRITEKTEIFIGTTPNFQQDPTIVSPNLQSEDNKTILINGRTNVNDRSGKEYEKNNNRVSRTVFGDSDRTVYNSESIGVKRTTRKLVGWLVSYSLDAMGVDYKIYEGRNIIGRDNGCNITVPDPMVSSRHAVLLFRANKYSITDSQSSHGTFVNDVDIELEPHYLNDGDIIRIGQTTFTFKTTF